MPLGRFYGLPQIDKAGLGLDFEDPDTPQCCVHVTHWNAQQASSAVHQRVTAGTQKLVADPARHRLGRGGPNGAASGVCVAHYLQLAGGRYGYYFVVQS
jgi:hypothetical protein